MYLLILVLRGQLDSGIVNLPQCKDEFVTSFEPPELLRCPNP